MHEKKIVELENFQANTTTFQTNINATLRNLETQVGQLTLSLQSQSRNTFHSSIEINLKISHQLQSEAMMNCMEARKCRTRHAWRLNQ